jgi:hypothetical protein
MVPKGTSRTPRQNRYQTLYQRIPFPCAYHFGTAQTGECPSCQSELSGYNSVRRSGNNPANNGQGGRSRSSGNVGVRGRPVHRSNLATPGSTWCSTSTVSPPHGLGRLDRHLLPGGIQQKSGLVTLVDKHACAGRFYCVDRYSVDVGVFSCFWL